MNIKSELQQLCGDTQNLRLNDVNIEPGTIRATMINEVVHHVRRRISTGNRIPRICQ